MKRAIVAFICVGALVAAGCSKSKSDGGQDSVAVRQAEDSKPSSSEKPSSEKKPAKSVAMHDASDKGNKSPEEEPARVRPPAKSFRPKADPRFAELEAESKKKSDEKPGTGNKGKPDAKPGEKPAIDQPPTKVAEKPSPTSSTPDPKKLGNKIWPVRLHKPGTTKTEKYLAKTTPVGEVGSDEALEVARTLREQIASAAEPERAALEQRWEYLTMGIKLDSGTSVDNANLSEPMVGALDQRNYDEFNRLANLVNAYRLYCNARELGADAAKTTELMNILEKEVKPATTAAEQSAPIERMQTILDGTLKGN